MKRLLSDSFGVYRAAYSGLPRAVWWLSASLFVNRAGTMVVPFLSLYLTDRLGTSATLAGQMIALFGVGSLAGSWVGGWLSDRVDSIRVLQSSLLGTGILFFAVVPVTSLVTLGALMFSIGLVADMFRPALMVAVTRASSDELRVRSFALVRLAANAGMAIGPAIGGWVATHNYSWLFLGDGLTCWAALVVLSLGLRGFHARRADRDTVTESAPSPSRGGAWTDAPFLGLLVLNFLIAITFFQVFTVLPLHLRDSYHLAQTAIGSVIALNALIIVLFEMVLLHRLEHLSQMKVAAVGGLFLGGGLVLLPLGPPMWIALVSTVIWTVGEMLLLPVSNVIVSRRGSAANTGSYMGAFMVTYSLAFIVAPALGGAVYDRFGPEILWAAAGGIGVIVFAGFRLLRPAIEGPQASQSA